MPQQSPADIVIGILGCYRNADHCLVNALLIDDHDKRLKEGLKCLTDRDICLRKIETSTLRRRNPDIARLKAQIGRSR